ncbi:MAG: RagB/SusD family nutrient uptake outer membrane protein, partial [Bacteroidales bacterium]|nr:RagB/SusD family nutrient uptake outer membrane protein [Bacteroidales bacterium]
MKKIKYNILFMASLGLFMLHSCSSDWTVIEQPGAQTTDGYYSNDAGARSGLIAIYAQLQRQYASSGYISPRLLKEAPSDEISAGGANSGDQAWLQQVNLYTNTETTPNITDLFRVYYFAIYRANILINNVDPTASDARKIIVAEAKALRAYLYFDLVNMFGSVPIVLEEQSVDEYLVEKSSIADIYAQIESDLTDAIPDLTDEKVEDWRVARGFAQTLLAKAYIFQGINWDDAADLCEEVMTSSIYSLEDNYDDCVHINGEWGVESMFELGFTTNIYGFPWLDEKNESQINIELSGCRDFIHGNGDWTDRHLEGWGFQDVTKYYYDLLDQTDPRVPYICQDIKDVYDQYYRADGDFMTTYATEMATGGDALKTIEPGHVMRWEGWDWTRRWQIEGIVRLKYERRLSEMGEQWASNGQNERLMRYAEVYL